MLREKESHSGHFCRSLQVQKALALSFFNQHKQHITNKLLDLGTGESLVHKKTKAAAFLCSYRDQSHIKENPTFKEIKINVSNTQHETDLNRFSFFINILVHTLKSRI